MKINSQMDLNQLRDRMGDATLKDAEEMRRLLVESSEWADTEEIPEETWNHLLSFMVE